MYRLILLTLVALASARPDAALPNSFYRNDFQTQHAILTGLSSGGLFGRSDPASAVPITTSSYYRTQPVWRGPLAFPTVLSSGYLADTPEVTAARSAHLAEYSRAAGFNTPQGFILDTPEVAAARAAHLTEHARATQNAYYNTFPQRRF